MTSGLDALGDRVWFDQNPHRKYRRRQSTSTAWVIIRRRSGAVLLRAVAGVEARGIPDTDAALREAWIAAAWPMLNPIERVALTKRIARREGLQ